MTPSTRRAGSGRRCLASALAVLLAWGLLLAPAHAQSPPLKPAASADPDGVALHDAAAAAVYWGDFAEAERLFKAARAQPRRTAAGVWEAARIRAGFLMALKPGPGLKVRQAEQAVALTALWTRQHPGSPLAHALHVSALTDLAWAHRGSGFANTVPQLAWEHFGAALERATQHAARHADVLLSDGLGFRSLLMVALGASWDDRRTQAVYEQGIARFPDEESLHFVRLNGLLPKWGGSARAVDQFIESVVKRTQATQGLALYALLYVDAAELQFAHALFTDSMARWERIDQGFADLTAKYPHRGHYNAWAWMACQAQDRKRLLELLEKVGATPDLDHWGDNARQTFDNCKAWAQKL